MKKIVKGLLVVVMLGMAATVSEAQIVFSPGLSVSYGFGPHAGAAIGAEISVFQRVTNDRFFLPGIVINTSYRFSRQEWSISSDIEYMVLALGANLTIASNGQRLGTDFQLFVPLIPTGPLPGTFVEGLGFLTFHHVFMPSDWRDLNELGLTFKQYSISPYLIDTRVY